MNSSQLLRALVLASVSLAGLSSVSAQTQAPADRQIVITDATRHVNVTSGTTVRFVAGERSFNWTFENINGTVVPFDLQKIAPAGVLTHAVTVYVAASPTYMGG